MEEDEIDNQKVYDAINDYYRLKSAYENRIEDMKKKIKAPKEITNKITGKTTKIEKSIEEKRNEIKLMKPKCIYCNKPVGTDFKITDKLLIAKCGAVEKKEGFEPCNLNIEIKKGSIANTRTEYYRFLNEKKTTEKNIINLKLDLLFKYSTEEETLEKFEKELEDYEYYVNSIQFSIGEIEKHTNKTEHKAKMTELDGQIKNSIEFIKDTIVQYKQQNDTQLLVEVINKYTDDLIPNVEQLRDIKNDYYDIEKNEITGEYTLVKTEVSVSNIEIILDNEDPEIIYFVQ